MTKAERDFIDASIAAREKAEAKKREREEAERLAFEARERDRREAAEAIAAEKGRQLQIEKKYSTRLKRGQWLLASLLLASIGSLVFALVQTQREKTARDEAISLGKQAVQAADEARMAEKEIKDLLKTQFGWRGKSAADGGGVTPSTPAITAGVSDTQPGAPAKPTPSPARSTAPTSGGATYYASVNPELYSVRQSLAANKLIQSAAKPDERERRKSIIVEYFAKTADENKVEAALTDLGFTLQKPQALLPGIASNAIWFGSPVPIDDVKLVALTLIRAGVQIKSISPSQLPGKKDAPLIQVGASTPAEKNPPYTVEEIQASKEFSR